jgi:hypothetical protein
MSDLKLVSDGATRRYELINHIGTINSDDVELIFLAHLGDYDLHWDNDNTCYTIVRERPIGGKFSYNFTDYHIIGRRACGEGLGRCPRPVSHVPAVSGA